MKLKTFAAAVTAAAVVFPSAALAATTATPLTTEGKTVSYKGGKVTVSTKKGKFAYTVNAKTDCGYSAGQMGNSMPCANLKKAKYTKQKVTVQWHRAKNGSRVADLVAVHLAG